MHKCKNCGAEFMGEYCKQCGATLEIKQASEKEASEPVAPPESKNKADAAIEHEKPVKRSAHKTGDTKADVQDGEKVKPEPAEPKVAVKPAVSAAAAPQSHTCAVCGAVFVGRFCKQCGTRVQEPAEPKVAVKPAVSATAAPQSHTCAVCGAVFVGRFCKQCGARVQEPAPAAQPQKFCRNCGAKLMPEAAFCFQCGAPVKK